MKFFSYGKSCEEKTRLRNWFMKLDPAIKRMIIMRINFVAILVSLCIMNVCASVRAQSISIDVQQAPLIEVLNQIRKQSGYLFLYDKAQIAISKKVTIKVKDLDLKQVLDLCFEQQPLTYEIVNRTIVIKIKKSNIGVRVESLLNTIKITGKILNENGEPLPGASIIVKGTVLSTKSNYDGAFTLNNVLQNATLIISYIGYESKEIIASFNPVITLARSTSKLDEVQVMAYGTTTQRLNTGSITKVTAEEISKQPVSNPLASLQGRVAGLNIVQSGGLAGSSFTVELRGQNSLATAGGSTQLGLISTPLFIIDGVPFAPNNVNINTLSSQVNIGNPNAGLSPFNSLNPSDIESIEVLKDADATAIYGSRGGNGVILITTKKGKAGKTNFTANISHALSQVTRMPKLMNTVQYLEMRNEAFKNDNIVPTIINAPDLKAWDQNKYTNFPKLFIGGTANSTNVQTSLSGGSSSTRFMLNGGYSKESSVFPTEKGSNRISALLNLNHISEDKRFKADISASYSTTQNNLPYNNLLANLILEPNYPDFIDTEGKYLWNYNGVSILNPLADLQSNYKVVTDNLLSSLALQYSVFKGFNIKANAGYNTMTVAENVQSPLKYSDPLFSSSGFASFGSNKFSSWSVEPQLEYKIKIIKGNLTALAGATWQSTGNNTATILAFGYTSDALLNSPSSAGSLTYSDTSYKYKYQAIFARLNYNLADKYILNLTARRDGSSRFGPDKQFGNFGAIGGAWIFSNEDFVKPFSKVLSYGKLRGSYGITGTDQIANYQYLDSWTNTSLQYQGKPGLYPSRLTNPDYSWEKNKKLEFGLELGFIKDRILITTSYYKNTGDNHLINYAMPSQTGFTTLTRNFPAVIVNNGWEFTLTSKNIVFKNFRWSTVGNISFANNTLTSFPGIESSSYSSVYAVGQSLDYIRAFGYQGVNPATGAYVFTDVDNSGTITSADILNLGNFNPKYSGGISNNFIYKNWQFDFFLEFKKQMGRNYLSSIYTSTFGVGSKRNVPIELMERWQHPSDERMFRKYTTTNADLAQLGQYNGLNISDASYIRLKNLSLSYNLSNELLKKMHLQNCKVYAQGQNLFTVTGFKVTDPETQLLNVLPPLRTFNFGLQLTL